MRLLTLARDLRRRRARERQGLFVAEGVRTVEELLASPLRVRGLLTTSDLEDTERGRRLLEEAARRGVERLQVTEADFRSAAETESPQGVLAVGVAPAVTLSALRLPATARVLVLDAVQDPGNVGTILRTAAALGVAATVALPGTVDVWNAKVVRSAMGALFRHPVIPSTTEQLAGWLAEQAVPLWGADARGEPLDGVEAPARVAIAVGNEGAGLTPPVRAIAARLVSLPIASEVESLNVAVATGILLYVLRT
ncbi:MAG TPA: RNA methyltransferase [Gemmatimonadaceae bacterium]|nr:RNA methyltransferase [Gemmatimonadaceae bacterium]